MSSSPDEQPGSTDEGPVTWVVVVTQDGMGVADSPGEGRTA